MSIEPIKPYSLSEGTSPSSFVERIETLAFTFFCKGKLSLFDASTTSNQCHLTALCIGELYHRYKTSSSLEALNNQERKFIVLSFFTSSTFLKNKKLLVERIIHGKSEKKQCNLFVNAQASIEKAREEVTEALYRRFIPSTSTHDELFFELSILAKRVLNSQSQVYPKFSGVILMIHELLQIKLPLLFKVKTCCEKGIHINTYIAQEIEKPIRLLDSPTSSQLQDVPFIVVEGTSLTYQKVSSFIIARAQCPQGFFSMTKAHASSALSCVMCRPCNEEHLTFPSIEGIKASDVLLAAAADFTTNMQHEVIPLFSSEFPKLNALFQIYLQKAHELQVSTEKPCALFIEHVYPQSGTYALTQKRLLDMRPENLLKTMEGV